jgi:TonB family protein
MEFIFFLVAERLRNFWKISFIIIALAFWGCAQKGKFIEGNKKDEFDIAEESEKAETRYAQVSYERESAIARLDASFFGVANAEDYDELDIEDIDDKEIFLDELKDWGIDLSLFEKDNNSTERLLDSLDRVEVSRNDNSKNENKIPAENLEISPNNQPSLSGWAINSQLIADKNDPDPEHDEFTKVDSEPVPINLNKVLETIVYPPDAKREGVKGTVYIKILIDRDGNPKDFYVRSSPDNRLKLAVLDKLKYAKYKPALLNGKPVKDWVQIEYEFK